MKDEFKLSIDAEIFRSTNDAWNILMLNDPWSVGYVTSLIELKEWNSKEEWEEYYYQSGAERLKLANNNIELIENFQLIRSNKNAIWNLSWDIKNLNFQYGRTKEDLLKRAEVLFKYMKNQGSPITLDQCFECVRYRTICETWNGVIIREENTVKRLQTMFGDQVEIKKTDGAIDHTYAVDYEVYANGKLKFGIQIKPKSYNGNAPYLVRARNANQRKFDAFRNKFGSPVFMLTSKSSGKIINSEVVINMQRALS